MDSIEKEISGHTYVIKPFLGMTGWKYQMRLGKMIGPALKEVLGSLPKGDLNSILKGEIDPAMLGGGIAAFIDALSDADPDGKFAAQLLSFTTRDGIALSESEINRAYAANYGEMIQALIAVVTANGFFGLGDTGLEMFNGQAAASPESSTKK
ncbi:MAG: hypothetical protein KJP02_07950 [Octadecabacter sp.]|nr:hypothetical protein [Octadecabacter sp.]